MITQNKYCGHTLLMVHYNMKKYKPTDWLKASVKEKLLHLTANVLIFGYHSLTVIINGQYIYCKISTKYPNTQIGSITLRKVSTFFWDY